MGADAPVRRTRIADTANGLAALADDRLAEAIARHPDRFAGPYLEHRASIDAHNAERAFGIAAAAAAVP